MVYTNGHFAEMKNTSPTEWRSVATYICSHGKFYVIYWVSWYYIWMWFSKNLYVFFHWLLTNSIIRWFWKFTWNWSIQLVEDHLESTKSKGISMDILVWTLCFTNIQSLSCLWCMYWDFTNYEREINPWMGNILMPPAALF